jgi:uncharacterized protein (TIGR01777 family)
MKVAVTGATGLIGRRVVAALLARGVDVTAISRSRTRGDACWAAASEPAPSDALAGRDAVIHLAGENVAQRWTDRAKNDIRESRVLGTENLLVGMRAAKPRPRVLICASAVGYYGDRGDERLDEQSIAGDDWLARVCVDWEQTAATAREFGIRVVSLRTGVALDRAGGALAKMLPPFRAGIGGPVAGGRQYMPWIHVEDVVGMYLSALDDERWSGPINATAPTPARNADFTRVLGQVLRRPAFLPVPGLALKAMYGEMAEVVTASQYAVPAQATRLGYEFRYTELAGALRAALS